MTTETLYLSGKEKIKTTRIIIASCYPLIQQALRINIEKEQDLEIVAETFDSKEATELSIQLHPDIVIMDTDMPLLSGLEASRQIFEKCSTTKVILLTNNNDVINESEMQLAGVCTYLPKKSSMETILLNIRAIANRERTFYQPLLPNRPRSIDHTPRNGFDLLRINRPNIQNTPNLLNLKEINILKLVANGKPNKEIACMLGISLPNVRATLTAIFMKLGVSSRTEATMVGLKNGYFTLGE